MKICAVCGAEIKRPRGLTCSALCSKEREREKKGIAAAEWNKKNGRAYRQANREKIRVANRKYAAENPEKVREYYRRYTQKIRLMARTVKEMGLLNQEDMKCL